MPRRERCTKLMEFDAASKIFSFCYPFEAVEETLPVGLRFVRPECINQNYGDWNFPLLICLRSPVSVWFVFDVYGRMSQVQVTPIRVRHFLLAHSLLAGNLPWQSLTPNCSQSAPFCLFPRPSLRPYRYRHQLACLYRLLQHSPRCNPSNIVLLKEGERGNLSKWRRPPLPRRKVFSLKPAQAPE